jgi:hypothetical protein
MIGQDKNNDHIIVIFGKGTVEVGVASTVDRKTAAVVFRELSGPHTEAEPVGDGHYSETAPIELRFDSLSGVDVVRNALNFVRKILKDAK